MPTTGKESLEADKIPIKIRPLQTSDVNFVCNSWVKSYRHHVETSKTLNPANAYIPKEVYFKGQQRLAEKLINADSSAVLVACMENDPEQIVGWICATVKPSVSIVHYCYVKAPFRLFGVATELIGRVTPVSADEKYHTHLTKLGEKVGAKFGFSYDPYKLIR